MSLYAGPPEIEQTFYERKSFLTRLTLAFSTCLVVCDSKSSSLLAPLQLSELHVTPQGLPYIKHERPIHLESEKGSA